MKLVIVATSFISLAWAIPVFAENSEPSGFNSSGFRSFGKSYDSSAQPSDKSKSRSSIVSGRKKVSAKAANKSVVRSAHQEDFVGSGDKKLTRSEKDAMSERAANAAPDRATLPPPKKKYDFSKSTNLDAVEATEGSLRSHDGTYKVDIDGAFDLQMVLQEIREEGVKGALKGAVTGLVGSVVSVLVAMVIRFASGQSNLKRMSEPLSRGSSGSFYSITATVAVIVGLGFAAAPIVSDAVKHASEHGKAKPLEFTPIHSFEFGVRMMMPEPFKKYRITYKPQSSRFGNLPAANLYGFNKSQTIQVPETEFTYYGIVHEEQRGGMALGYAKLPPLPQSTGNVYYYYDVNKGLDAAVANSVKAIKGKTTFTCLTSLQGKHPGRESEGILDKDAGIFRQRVFISNGGFYYHIAVYGEKTWVDSNDAYKFLDSIEVRR